MSVFFSILEVPSPTHESIPHLRCILRRGGQGGAFSFLESPARIAGMARVYRVRCAYCILQIYDEPEMMINYKCDHL